MIKWLHSKIKWLVAGKELEELERWRSYWQQTDRWFAEFPEAEIALRYLEAKASGTYSKDIAELRNELRKEKKATP